MKKLLVVTLLGLLAIGASGEVRFGAPFGDNMVVVQNRQNPIWGTANPEEVVRIVASWAMADTITVTTNNYGRWKAVLSVPSADNKSHTITANGVVLTNVAIGEVWLCSGQSNMEWSANSGIKNAQSEIENANFAQIRIFQVPKEASDSPQHYMHASWKPCTPDVMRTASAIGYFFGRDLTLSLNIPIGIISDAWGGTVIETWMPYSAIAGNAALEGKLHDNKTPWWSATPGVLYNSMINPLIPMALSGVIWYQGESNCDGDKTHPEVYEQLLKTLIATWRKDFNYDLPFYFVQIAPFNYSSNDSFSATLRQQQMQVAQSVNKTGIVIIGDLVDNVNDIHPQNKQPVASRLAGYALAEVYGIPIPNYKSPMVETIKIDKSTATLTFKNVGAGLEIRGQNAVGLKIAGASGEFFEARAKVSDGNKLVVWSSKVKKPVKVSYCYDKATIGNIFSSAGLPVAPFFK